MRRTAVPIVAALCLTAATLEARDTPIPGWFDLPVPGGAATLAALGIPPEERAHTIPILARMAYDTERGGRATPQRVFDLFTGATRAAAATANAEALVVPAPLDAETWRDLLAPSGEGDLFAALVADRRALAAAAALMSADHSVRTWLSRDRDLLQFLWRDAHAGFGIVARRLRLREGAVVVPGGDGADRIWARLAGANPSEPAAFVRALVTRDHGRLAWYFDSMAGLDEERLAAAWPGSAPAARRTAAEALYHAFRDSDAHWRIADQPFKRPVAGVWTILTHATLQQGRLVGPIGNGSLADLVQQVAAGAPQERRARVEAALLGQRVFPAPDQAERNDIAFALEGFERFRALLFALERMEIEPPRTWAALVRAARHVADDSDDRRASIVAFQAAVGLVDRIRHVRTLDAAGASQVLLDLAEGALRSRRVTRAVATWITSSLLPALPPLERPDAFTGATAYESILLQALAGPRTRPTPAIEWEGLRYVVDVVAAEGDRIRAVRAQLPSPGLDRALESGKPDDLAAALTALVYAPALGAGDGAVTLSREVATRHDLGLSGPATVRELRPWAPPEERQGLGAWRVEGALIGLDLGLARLALRRVSDEQMPPAPTLTLNDLATLARTVVALVPLDLADADRDELAAAIARGRQRVAGAGADLAAIDALADEAGVSAVTRQLLPWIASRQPDGLAAIFAVRDLLWLGRPALPRPRIDRWGMAAGGIDGRWSTAMPAPVPWEDYAGRSELGQIATQMPDLTLRLVEETARLKLPALIVPALLAFAVNDYWHDVQVRFTDDWWRMRLQAEALPATRIEDYVAALAGTGLLRTR